MNVAANIGVQSGFGFPVEIFLYLGQHIAHSARERFFLSAVGFHFVVVA